MTDSTSDTLYHLERLARKLRANPDYMASVLAVYQQHEQLSEAALAHRLSIDSTQLTRLALCKRPNTQSVNFPEQIHQIAIYVGAGEIALAQIIRLVESLQVFSSLAAGEKPVTSTATPESMMSGLLSAARDRQEDDSKEPQQDDETEDEDGT